ncbi:hypothetical protein PV11_10106 [Exophiala sideris]|uniref:Uncharacterized protein n=1 Tax=Exophiala sideris TaxID=1016849 RepID=A0A0D1YC08_9EURO|nr:hypothetical protein PV11_10106 [Exophiala sideris]
MVRSEAHLMMPSASRVRLVSELSAIYPISVASAASALSPPMLLPVTVRARLGSNRTIAQCASVPEHLEGRARDLLAMNRRLVRGEVDVTIAAVESLARVLNLEMTTYTREVNRAARAARAAPAPIATDSPTTPISNRLLPAPPNAPLMRSLTASATITTATTSLASLKSRIGRIEAATFLGFDDELEARPKAEVEFGDLE